MILNLKGGNVTIGEIMNDPKGFAIMKREFPKLIGTPMFKMAQRMSLNRVIQHWGHHVPRSKIQSILNELKSI